MRSDITPSSSDTPNPLSGLARPGAFSHLAERPTLSRRAEPGTPNPIALRRAELAASGIELTDLTDTNPTRHGLFDPAVLDVVSRHLPRASRYEPTPRGPWPARAALAERYGGDPDDYWLTASTSQAYGWLFCLLGNPGDAVAIPSPGYPLIDPLARLHSLTTASYRTFYVHPSGWELDPTHLRETVADKSVRAVVAVNPNNPTGAYAEPAVREIAAERVLPLIADEVFFPFRLDTNPSVQRGTTASASDANPVMLREVAASTSAPSNLDPAISRRMTEGQVPPATTNNTGPSDDSPVAGTNPVMLREVAASTSAPSNLDPATSRRMTASNTIDNNSIDLSPVRLSGNDDTLTFGLDGLSKLLAAPQLKLGWIRLSGPHPEKIQVARALDEIADTYLGVSTPIALALPDLLTLADDTITRITQRLRTNLATARTVFKDLRIRTTYGGWMMLLDVPPLMDADSLSIALMDQAGLYVHPGYFYDLPDSTLAISLLPAEPVFQESCQRLYAALTVFAD